MNELFVSFRDQCLVGHIICNYFLLFSGLTFHLVYGFLWCANVKSFIRSHCISLVYFLLPWETGLRRFRFLWENALPAFFSGSSWCDVSYFSPQNIFCSFLLTGGHMDPNFSDSPISVWVPQTPLAEDNVFFPLGWLKCSFMFSHNILQKYTKEILANRYILASMVED